MIDKERIIEKDWKLYKLNLLIDRTATDIHHIISKKEIHKFKVNDDKNKIKIQRRKHVALNNFFLDNQNPRKQLQVMYDIRKTALSPGVRNELYTLLSLPDDMFYDKDLIKWTKQKTNTNTDT